MRRAYRDVSELATSAKLDMRTAAFVLAVRRVVRAASLRRSVRQALPPSLLG
jgi:glutamate dehydrogenase/leucine dehydrogenase